MHGNLQENVANYADLFSNGCLSVVPRNKMDCCVTASFDLWIMVPYLLKEYK